MLEINTAPEKMPPMFFKASKNVAFKVVSVLLLSLSLRLNAAPNGPTLQLDYGRGNSLPNTIAKFMYFVPLISPGTSVIYTNVGNQQYARVLSFNYRTNGTSFLATCEFEFTGNGSLHNIFDPTEHLVEHKKELAAGGVVKHQLGAINVEGGGTGSIAVEGTITNGLPEISKVSIHFASHGHTSPVLINLMDFAEHGGAVQKQNEMVARVNSLVFQRCTGTPKMVVTLDSLKNKDASDSVWQNFVGSLKGMTANCFLPPLTIAPEGQKTMLDFGLALTLQKPDFTFPFATRLKGVMASQP